MFSFLLGGYLGVGLLAPLATSVCIVGHSVSELQLLLVLVNTWHYQVISLAIPFRVQIFLPGRIGMHCSKPGLSACSWEPPS